MPIESNPVNHSNQVSVGSSDQQVNGEQARTPQLSPEDQKVQSAIPSEIAYPEEHPAKPAPPIEFQAKTLNPESEAALPEGLLQKTLGTDQTSALASGILTSLAADVLEQTVQLGKSPTNVSDDGALTADMENFDDMSPEELERMLAAMDSQETAAHSDLKILEKQINEELQVFTGATAGIADETQILQESTDAAKAIENSDQHLERTGQHLERTDQHNNKKLEAAQQETLEILREKGPKPADVKASIAPAAEAGAAEAAAEAAKAKLENQVEILDHIILQKEHEMKSGTAEEAAQLKPILDHLREKRAEIQEKLDSGMSHEEVLKTTTIGGKSLHEMTENDLHEMLHSLTITAREEPKEEREAAGPRSTEREGTRKASGEDNAAKRRQDTVKKEDMSKLRANQERIALELQYQQARGRIEKDKEKIEQSLQKILESVQEDRKMKDIEKTEIKKDAAASQIVADEDKQKAIKGALLILDNIAQISMPVKKETLRMVVSVIRQLDIIPGGKSDPGIRDLQKTLIGFYQDIRPAVGVEALGGTGSAAKVHTKQQ